MDTELAVVIRKAAPPDTYGFIGRRRRNRKVARTGNSQEFRIERVYVYLDLLLFLEIVITHALVQSIAFQPEPMRQGDSQHGPKRIAARGGNIGLAKINIYLRFRLEGLRQGNAGFCTDLDRLATAGHRKASQEQKP